MLKVIQGNAQSATSLLWGIGVGGAILSLAAHFFVWRKIGEKFLATGTSTEWFFVFLGLFGVYLLGMFLGSVYTLLPALATCAYALEQVWGLHLLRYMPLESTKLYPALYLLLPIGAMAMLIGALSTILLKFISRAS
ncbi:MAG: hypothetical protein HC913_12370 [Microscillaceae bacterium]|nr:hypothetical protein [Microscillaceae bacterium]